MTSSERGGEVIQFERGGLPAVSREEYEKAIKDWCHDRTEILAREEIGAMGWLDRMDAQRKAIIVGLVHYYRQHERSDVAPGVAVLLTLMSDNERGCASISQPTLAKLFGRSVSSIADAQRRLKDDGIIIMGRGRYAGTYPVIPRVVTEQRNHMAWLVSALADMDKTVKLPVRQDDCQSTGPAGGLNQSIGGTGGLKQLNHPVEDPSIIRPAPIQLHSKNSTIVDTAAKIAAAVIASSVPTLPAAAKPSDPPAIVMPVRTVSVHQLADKLFEAAGASLNRTTGKMESMQRPLAWIDAGCDLELDILPAVRRLAGKRPPGSISSWKFFEQAIADDKAERTAPMAEGRSAPGNDQRRRPALLGSDIPRTIPMPREEVT